MEHEYLTPDEQYLTPDELVSRWKGCVKLTTLETWRVKKKGPEYIKIGQKGVLYPIQAVKEFERQHTFKTR